MVDTIITEHPILFSKYFFQKYYTATLQIIAQSNSSYKLIITSSHTSEPVLVANGVEFFKFLDQENGAYILVTSPVKHKVYIKFETASANVKFQTDMNQISCKQFVSKQKFGSISTDFKSGTENTQAVSKWNPTDVVTWLSYLRGSDGNVSMIPMSDCKTKSDDKTIAQVFKEEGITGKDLLGLTVPILQENFKLKYTHAKEIESEIKFLKERNGYDMQMVKLLQKLEMNQSQGQRAVSKSDNSGVSVNSSVYDQFKEIREVMTNPHLFKEKYMNMTDLSDDTIRKFKIKLVITELPVKNKLMSRITHHLPLLSNQYGLFHAALIFGPWYLEWNDSALCYPRKISSSKAVFCGDVGFELDSLDTTLDPQEKRDKIESIVNDLVKFIVNINVNATYCNFGEYLSLKKGGNCQDFVAKCLEIIDAKVDFEKHVKSLLDRMSKTGEGYFTFRVTHSKMIQLLPTIKANMKAYAVQIQSRLKQNYAMTEAEIDKMFDKNRVTFCSHVQLDAFCKYLEQELCKVEGKSKEEICSDIYFSEFQLLKSYDRAYWLRLLKANVVVEKWQYGNIAQEMKTCTDAKVKERLEIENTIISERSKWEPLERVGFQCYFQDPATTASLPMPSSK